MKLGIELAKVKAMMFSRLKKVARVLGQLSVTGGTHCGKNGHDYHSNSDF
jgi:hypothetical protein